MEMKSEMVMRTSALPFLPVLPGAGGGHFVGPRRFGRGMERDRMNSFRKSCGTKIYLRTEG